MSSSQMPPGGPPAGGPPPGVPPQPRNGAAWPQATPAPRESRGVSFFIAVFLGILLVASAGLNVLLLLVSVGSLAGGGAIGGDDDGVYDEVHVAGERGEKARILQVSLHGAIAEGASPVIGAAGGSVSQVRRALRQAEKDDIAGVLLDINSPGGGVTDSDEIYDLIARFRRDHPDKPVISLFGDMAASGGYYVAAASEHILARRTTITGSIGVIMSAWNFAEAAKKFGVEQVAIKSDRTPMKDILSPTRPMREDERALLTGIVDELFDRFVTVVDEGREKMDRAQVLAVATGAVYTAGQALKNGLIDEIGDHETAVAWFEKKLSKKVEIVERRRRAGLADLLLGGRAEAPSIEQSVGQLLVGSTGPRFLYFWEGGR
ncbi:MAG: signal peptide peptidase SppA [Planctomycetes bacterium]|nr:signal peptide peptidase SppA [Planctomycetota bacterium]